MKRIIGSMFGAGLVILALVATVSAAEPTPPPGTQLRAQDTIPELLGMTHQEIMALRHQGQSLARIAESKDVDPQVLIDALVARWDARITVRDENGALTEAEAATLRARLETQARSMVYMAAPGGMQGAAVGAGPGQGRGAGMGQGAGNGQGAGMGQGAGNGVMRQSGDGTCTGNGPGRAGQP
jgi:hypothetical protein